MAVKKEMNHTEYQKKCRKMSPESLRHVMKDAIEARDAMPDGPNVGYYSDEIIYCGAELNRRSEN